MLKYYVRHSSGEEFQRVTVPPKDNVWIHGDAVTEHELRLLSDIYGMNLNVLRDVLDKDELPRVEIRDDELYVFVRTANRNKRGQVVTTPVLLAVKGSVFANVSTAETEDHKLATPSVLAQTSDTTSLLLGTFATVVEEYQGLMLKTSHHIHDTGKRLRTHEVTNDDFIKFVTVEDNLNEYRMNLGGMLVVAERLQETLKRSDDAEAVQDVVLYIRQLIVAIESYNQSIVSIRNAYGTVANNVLNQRMKTLTALTVLLALPNVFYGMYGMNVPLPYQNDSWAYVVIVGFSISMMITVILIARKKGIF